MHAHADHDTTGYSQADLNALVERILKEARTRGASQAEAGASIEVGPSR
jgi:hypothetical protein